MSSIASNFESLESQGLSIERIAKLSERSSIFEIVVLASHARNFFTSSSASQ